MIHGFVRVAAAVPEIRVADCAFNVQQMISLAIDADKENVAVVVFPELSVTAYTCADLFYQHQLLSEAETGLQLMVEATNRLNTVVIFGLPLRVANELYNVAVVAQKGRILGIVPKTHLPNNGEFYEKRWFASGGKVKRKTIVIAGQETTFGTDILFENGDFTFAIELCEDLWLPIPPSCQHAMHGAEIIFNLSASNELIGKNAYRVQLIEQQSARCISGYVYASAGHGESTTDVVFSGSAYIAENGRMLAQGERFSFHSQFVASEIDIDRLRADRIRNSNFNAGKSEVEYAVSEFLKVPDFNGLKRRFAPHPFVPPLEQIHENCNEIFAIQVGGLAKRWQHTHAQTLVIGISGGLDSTLALLVAVKTADQLGFDRKRIIGITMPGFGTTDRTYSNALGLMGSLGITIREISIKEACTIHFNDIGHDMSVHDVTYENVQARERTQILMDVANKENGLVIGTGDLSELALGWATYNGDHMSMYAVNSGVPKTLVRYIVGWAAGSLDSRSEKILKDVLDTPVSPELLPADEEGNIAQKTEDVVGPYELHDFFLYYFVRFGFSPSKIFYLARNAFQGTYEDETIKKWLEVFIRRFFAQQFKRSCIPDGPKVGSINLSPRGDWRMPSDAVAFEVE